MNSATVITVPTNFPPSFAGDPLTFAYALFSLTAIASFSLATMLSIMADARVMGWRPREPLGIMRIGLLSLLGTIFLGSIGDVAFLYAWGEASPRTLLYINQFDRVCDTLCFPTFAVFGFMLTRGRPAIIFQLTKTPLPVDMLPTWPMIRRQIAAVSLILFISVLVTIGK